MQYNILDILRYLRGGKMSKVIEYETPENCSDCKFYRGIDDNQYGICEYFEKLLKKEHGCFTGFIGWDGINKCDECEENNETD